MLTFNTEAAPFLREFRKETFNDVWSCHQYIAQNKMNLLAPQIIKYGKDLKGFDFYCESRSSEVV